MTIHRRHIPTAVAMLVAVAALVVAVLAIQSAQHATLRLNSLRTRIQTILAQTGANEAQANQIVTVETELHKVGPQFQAIRNCLPELQEEISGLSISWKFGGGQEPSWTLTNSKPPRSGCEKVLYEEGEHSPMG